LQKPDTKTPVTTTPAAKRRVANVSTKVRASTSDHFAALWRQYGRGILGLLIMVLIVHDIFGTHGFLAMRHTQAEINTVKANLARLNVENGQLSEKVHDLKTDPRTIEKLAREGSLLAKPGEFIIKIPQDQWPGEDQPNEQPQKR
jgi:cell division protein FtsB